MSFDKYIDRASGKKPERTNGHANGQGGEKKNGDRRFVLPSVFYDAPKRAFWAQNQRKEWIEYPATHIRLLLKQAGIPEAMKDGEPMTPLESHFLRIRQENDVQWAGPLAGYQPGIHEMCGTRLLVTQGPKIIKGAKGDWQKLKTLMSELLGEQVEYLWGWLKSALIALRAGRPFRPGQALAIAGPAGCGKSLLQGLLTEILGGRSAKPYRYLSGETPFNGELFWAEHLMIEDEAASTDIRTRRHFGSQLKNLIANEIHSFHQKGRQAMTAAPFWRVTITLNDEAENLMVLPPFDESMRDKIILLKAFHATMPFETDHLSERRQFREALTAELPAFVHWLQNWRLPGKMTDKRYGVRAWQNPELLQELESLQPEFRLLELIDTLGIWENGVNVWRGTASELRSELEQKDRRGEVSRLLSFNTAAGVYLSRLKKHFPQRIEQKRGGNNLNLWEIHRQ